MPPVTLYTRAGCGLCDEMKAALEQRGYVVVEVDIDADPELKAKYGLDIPVAVQGGKLLAKHRLR
ncbi:MAG: glutaredoxin family protein [Bryobacterales bacterium]|nr:glutaredoxin family protein [Acidobacteriota bacterium]MCB9386052.1 glutaredoxin family protein [Bryobacterales bacterium]